jgi:UDP-glucose 6-dehydrogenase
MSKFEKEQQFKYPKVLIAGYGIVGKHLKDELFFAETYDPDYDQGADYTKLPKYFYDIAFIAVPTSNNKGKCDIKFVEQAIQDIDANIYVIKSTIPPDTTKKLKEKYNKKNNFFTRILWQYTVCIKTKFSYFRW